MTTQEFKEQHPDKAHLQGNDLWNAMEDVLLAISQLPPQTGDMRTHPIDGPLKGLTEWYDGKKWMPV